MNEMFERTELLLGEDGIKKLNNAKVAVFGVGGVGGYIVEALARSGIGEIHLFDNDTVALSNKNRQIIATDDTLGMLKTDAAKQRILSINKEINVVTHNMFYLPENANTVNLEGFSYVADALDTIVSKVELAVRCEKLKVPLISSMGAGNKLNPVGFTVADIYSTSVCPLAKVMRKLLKEKGVKKLKVVYTKEPPKKPLKIISANKRAVPGSVAFVPSVAGLIMAGEIVKDIISK